MNIQEGFNLDQESIVREALYLFQETVQLRLNEFNVNRYKNLTEVGTIIRKGFPELQAWWKEQDGDFVWAYPVTDTDEGRFDALAAFLETVYELRNEFFIDHLYNRLESAKHFAQELFDEYIFSFERGDAYCL